MKKYLILCGLAGYGIWVAHDVSIDPDHAPSATALGVAIIGFFYFAPTIVAKTRGSRDTLAIFLVNLFLGWTGVGYFASLVWACMGNNKPVVIHFDREQLAEIQAE